MNIVNLLNSLKEDIDVKKFNSLIQNDVPTETIETLASRMKKGKYDSKAVAVLKAAQEWKSEWGDYIRKNAGKVYAILKLMAQGNSDFNPEKILLEFRNYRHGVDQFDTFWKIKYNEARAGKYVTEKKRDFGLKNAKSKELPDAFIVFPRTFKKTGQFGIDNADDIENQYQDIKKISYEMARKDSSGKKGANDNHWCVASPDSGDYHYRHYKDRGGIFLIILDKNKDGSPNWNNRYLYWISDEGETEFADKMDTHVYMEDVLDRSTINWLNKFQDEYLKNRKNKINDKKINDTLRTKVKADIETYKKENKPSGNLKKIFKLFSDRLKESTTKGNLKEAIDGLQKINNELAEQNNLVKWFVKKGAEKHHNGWSVWYILNLDNFWVELSKTKKSNGTVFGLSLDYYDKETKKLQFSPEIQARSLEALKKKLIKAKEKGVLKIYDEFRDIYMNFDGAWGDYSRNRNYLKKTKADWNKGQGVPETSETYKKAVDALHNNKKLIQAYRSIMRNQESRVVENLDDHFVLISELDNNGEKKLTINFYPRSRFAGYEVLGTVDDPDIIDKIKESFDWLDHPEKRKINGGHKDGEPVRPKKDDYEDLPF